ncbi:Retron-type reverse transcriptase [Marinobacter sp. DSM 26671]|jgi:hypothetical protein|uniref:retron St85 family RNA-directed DNA polymerase n=1 Tax=Marinobacter sp. DSM 26671 TaxID=1761793 RepID=UPI0008E1A37D|nr:retron St85 family RNA-directed DNA polymerase [Marinobacter sp. DSM 26671]SFE88813.1 Retron-type reverse transcriptase [Marinobacter sp. DSM 26671]
MSLIEQLSKRTNLPLDSIQKYAKTCPVRYKVYSIPKRNGKGFRVIAQPSAPVKALQRELVSILEDYILVHECAMAYREGVSIFDNASKHKDNDYLLKMDFKDFFPSIDPATVLGLIMSQCPVAEKSDTLYLLSILCRKPRGSDRFIVSIGAPSSPFISNAYMYVFDDILSKLLVDKGISYTRYADDLTFSTRKKGALFEVPALVKKVLVDSGYRTIRVNEEKTVFSSKKHNRHVTGLVLTNDGRVSLGRSKKREIRTLIFKYLHGELSKPEVESLKGLASHARHIEPEFWERLKSKYGIDDSFFKL